MATYQAVIARYEEDLSWADMLGIPAVIYNKGRASTLVNTSHPVIARANLGRESETYIHHIIENFDRLPDYLVLLQGNPFDHCPSVLEVIRNHVDDRRVVALGNHQKRESLEAQFNWSGFKERIFWQFGQMGAQPPKTLRHTTGAQYIAPRDAIREVPLELYRSMLSALQEGVSPMEGWVLERMWPSLLGLARNPQTDRLKIDALLVVLPEHSLESIERSLRSLLASAQECVRVSEARHAELTDQPEISIRLIVPSDQTKSLAGLQLMVSGISGIDKARNCSVSIEECGDPFRVALEKGTDLILLMRTDSALRLETIVTSVSTLFKISEENFSGKDLILELPEGAYFFHRAIVSLHWDLFVDDQRRDPLERLIRERQVPLLALNYASPNQ